MSALYDKILGRHLRRSKDFESQHCRILGIRRSEYYALGARVVADLSFSLENGTTLVLPPPRNIIDIVQRRTFKHQRKCHSNLLLMRLSCPPHNVISQIDKN